MIIVAQLYVGDNADDATNTAEKSEQLENWLHVKCKTHRKYSDSGVGGNKAPKTTKRVHSIYIACRC